MAAKTAKGDCDIANDTRIKETIEKVKALRGGRLKIGGP
jgi:hypothetical protein